MLWVTFLRRFIPDAIPAITNTTDSSTHKFQHIISFATKISKFLAWWNFPIYFFDKIIIWEINPKINSYKKIKFRFYNKEQFIEKYPNKMKLLKRKTLNENSVKIILKTKFLKNAKRYKIICWKIFKRNFSI